MRFVGENMERYMFDPYEIRKEYAVELDQLYGSNFENEYMRLVSDIQSGIAKVRYVALSAREILKKIMKTQVETGLPYLFFKDTVNKDNANKHDGIIPCGNLCQESFTNTKYSSISNCVKSGEWKSSNGYAHTCNLASLNLANIHEEEDLEFSTRMITRILDNTITITETPIFESYEHNRIYRAIGIGAMGLHDHLVYEGMRYYQSADYVDSLFERKMYYALRASHDLALSRGAYFKFPGSEWNKGVLLGKYISWLMQNSSLKDLKEKWLSLI